MIDRIERSFSAARTWLGAEAEALVPAGLRTLAGGTGKRWIVDLSSGDPVLLDPANGRSVPLSSAGPLRARGVDPDNLLVRLAADAILDKTVDLPQAAEGSLDQVLRFEMDRLTPFREEDVYFTWALLGRYPAERRLVVRLRLVPRRLADQALAHLRGMGIEPIALELGPDEGDRHLFPVRSVDPLRRRVRRVQAALVVLLVLIGGGIAWAELHHRQVLLEAATRELAKARDEAGRAEILREQLEEARRRASFVTDRRASRPLAVQLLDELARLLPDHAWITQLRLEPGQIEIAGASRSVTDTVRKLETSPLFVEIGHRSPVTRDARDGVDRFQLTIRLRELES